jgi:integrase
MVSRRDFGSVRRLPSGRWQATYWHDGRRHTAPETFKAKADGTAWLAATQTSILKGQWIDPTAGKVTFGDYTTTWIAKRSDLRPTTRSKYESLFRLHLKPAFSQVELAKLAASGVRSWYHDLAGRYPVVADDAYRLLRAVCSTAIADGALGRSPCQVKGAGQVRSGERPVATVSEVAAAVEAIPDRYQVAILLAAFCQLRRGEVLGLQRRDVDHLHGTIRIERAWVPPMGGAPILGPPKTEASTRTLSVPPNVLPALKDHLERFAGVHPDAWLFPTSTGTALSPRNFTRAWSKARAKVGRPDLHLHDLRHSGLTWAAASGASLAELMRRGGHANPRAALRYQHATADRDKVIAEALAALAEKAPVVPIAHAARTRVENQGLETVKAPHKKGA